MSRICPGYAVCMIVQGLLGAAKGGRMPIVIQFVRQAGLQAVGGGCALVRIFEHAAMVEE